MLNILSTLAGGLGSLKRACTLNMALMGAQQASYVVAFFLLQALMPDGGGGALSRAVWICLLAGLAVAYCVLNLRYLLAAFTGAYAISSSLRLRLCNHLRGLSLAFFKARDTGVLSASVIDDIKSMETVFGMYLFDLIACLAFPLLLGLIMLFFSWQITGVLLLSVMCALPLMLLACRVTASQGHAYLKSRDDAFASLMDYVGGIRELKAADLTGLRYTPLYDRWKQYQRLSMKMEGQYGALSMAYSSTLDLGFLATMLAGLHLVGSGAASIPAFMFFLVAGCRFVEPMQQLGVVLPELRHGISAAQRLYGIMQTQPLPVHGHESPRGHAVEFEDVSFDYGNGRVIHKVSFSMPEGSVTALVGHSGSGKSTLAHLLLRFWDVEEGRITLGGANIRAMEPEDLYAHFSVVFQDVYLFDDTVCSNIRMARPEAAFEEVVEAARKARCHDFIEQLENGYDTRIGEGGALLSGGEKQRISIARAILKNAPVVILDEATAALDPENELHIQEGLNSLLAGKTLLVIAHRLETIRHADAILVLEQGRICESGTHASLLDLKDGVYARLWRHQNTLKTWQLPSGGDSSPGMAGLTRGKDCQ